MNFKKHINALLALFLLVSNMGFSFNVHYCEDEIASITLNTATKSHEIEKDCCGVMEKKSKCCKNKIIKTNEKSVQQIVKSISLDRVFNLTLNEWKSVNFPIAFNLQQNNFISYYCDANAPPLYLLYSQYTFYS